MAAGVEDDAVAVENGWVAVVVDDGWAIEGTDVRVPDDGGFGVEIMVVEDADDATVRCDDAQYAAFVAPSVLHALEILQSLVYLSPWHNRLPLHNRPSSFHHHRTKSIQKPDET